MLVTSFVQLIEDDDEDEHEDPNFGVLDFQHEQSMQWKTPPTPRVFMVVLVSCPRTSGYIACRGDRTLTKSQA